MLNVYPDSVGGTVSDVVDLVTDPAVTGAFSAVYLLPSVFNTDLDRGFSVIDYGLNRMYATQADLDALRDAGISLKLDFILNHASVLSPQFQDLVAKGDRSAYKDFFVDWNAFWAGHGTMTEGGFVRLDAFAYAPKEPGATNFLNDPGTWDLLARVKELADDRGLKLLPEIHARYEEGIHELLAKKGFMTYDFFLPGLVIDALARRDASVLTRWIREVVAKQIRTVTMLGCHDGIPLLDLKGLLDDERIEAVIEMVKSRGGYVKDLHGAKNIYYQVNATYYSALGESDAAMPVSYTHLTLP